MPRTDQPGGRDEPHMPWDRRDDESDLAYNRFRLYLQMGMGRSLAGAWKRELEQRGEKPPPEGTGRHYKAMSIKYDWAERAQAYDTYRLDQTEHQLEEFRLREVGRRQELLDGLYDECVSTRAALRARREAAEAEALEAAEMDESGVVVALSPNALATRELREFAQSVDTYCKASRREAGVDVDARVAQTIVSGKARSVVVANEAAERARNEEAAAKDRLRRVLELEDELENLPADVLQAIIEQAERGQGEEE